MNDRELFTSDATAVQVDEQDPQQMQVSSSLLLTKFTQESQQVTDMKPQNTWQIDQLRHNPVWLLLCCVSANVEGLAPPCS